VKELNSVLRHRFNTVVLPLLESLDEGVQIVQRRVEQPGRALEPFAEPPALEEIPRVITAFRESRNGVTGDGKTKLKSPSATLSTAEAIGIMNQGSSLVAHYG